MSKVQSRTMHLGELLQAHAFPSAHHVPDWMMGLYRRHCIAFADGTSDTETQVFWLQSRNFSIDLRLPRNNGLVAAAKPWAQYAEAELRVLGQYEGWVAQSVWDGKQLVWREPTALQLHDRWPEPAPLQRVGNCMIEFAPSGIYVEDWRLQPSKPGPLIGLRLTEERELAGGKLRHRGGGLIVSGDYAGLVLGRAQEPEQTQEPLLRHVLAAAGDAAALGRLFNFETSIARGSMASGYEVTHSTLPGRAGQALLPLDGFSLGADGTVHQRTEAADGVAVERIFTIDALEKQYAWPQATPATAPSQAWADREAATLKRYTRALI
ncbi:hypothetical protein D9O50_17760 [Oxalobacteraceae bacterium CAVE-383]|nr:hypothetical protein D9O50_17760 [Oxalobacteraceae bacterium CAVE-383]